jgi:photosystem II stability/assembly factor-like uncharacterized protein
MNRTLAVVAALALAILAAGCAPKAVQNGQKGSPSAVPFSELQVPPLDTADLVSDTVGYVGGQGAILKSTDGGQTWAKLYTCPDNVVSVDAVDDANVWAATGDYLLHSTDGCSFQGVDPAITAGRDGKGISAIDFVSLDQGYILADGVIWRLTNGRDVQRATPPGRVDSMSFVDPNHGFAAGANTVYKTSDGGSTWARVFAAPVESPSYWRALIRAGSAENACLMVYGGDAGAGHVGYVVFHTKDGKHFVPVIDEAYIGQTDYPTVHLDNSRNLVIRPGTITVHGDRDAFFVGFGGADLFLIRTVDNGKNFTSFDIGSQGDTLTDTGLPVSLSFADTMHGWLVGTNNNGQGVILHTTDGKTFKPAT